MTPSKEEVLAVTPAALVGWAKRTGWHYRDLIRYAEVYGREDDNETVVLPWKSDIADYASRVWDAVTVFAVWAETDELSVLRELLAADRDLLNVAVTRQSSRSGNEPGCREVLGGVRRLLAGSAGEENLVSWDSDGVVARRSRFSVTLLAPPEAADEAREGGGPVRDLMRKLGHAAFAVEREKRGFRLEPAVENAIRNGVTADLLMTLRGMTLDFQQVCFSMEGGWNIAAEAPADEVVFTSVDSPVLVMAARTLSEMSPGSEAETAGPSAPDGP